jgi:hypothetical protein
MMDWGTALTGAVFATMVILMGAINSLDRKIAQHKQHQLAFDKQELDIATATSA